MDQTTSPLVRELLEQQTLTDEALKESKFQDNGEEYLVQKFLEEKCYKRDHAANGGAFPFAVAITPILTW